MTVIKKYSPSHEWIEIEGSQGVVGITKYAQGELGEVVYVELPLVGKKVEVGEEVVVLESTKAASDIYAPVSGEILEVNSALKEGQNISKLNQDPEGEGWLFKIRILPSDVECLLTENQYRELIHS